MNDKKVFFCENCQATTQGKLINVTGYTDLVCDGCDKTLVSDYLQFAKLEEEIYGNECAFCGAVTDSSYTSRIPPHQDIYCCYDCFDDHKGGFDGFG